MTWIVAMPTPWGYSIGVSDVRVTLLDGSERDCLQKIYPIANSLALGFAGSVYIGLSMVSTMQTSLRLDDAQAHWLPTEVLKEVSKQAREIFAGASVAEKKLKSHLIVLSADPTVQPGPNPFGPLACVHILKSPDFAPVELDRPRVSAIGSGSFIEQYKEALDEISENHERRFQLMRGEVMNPGGMGEMLGFVITRLIQETNPTGISSHLHYCWVYWGKTIIRTNDHVKSGAWTGTNAGSGINRPESEFEVPPLTEIPGATYFKMPEIAQSWLEFDSIIRASGARAECAVT